MYTIIPEIGKPNRQGICKVYLYVSIGREKSDRYDTGVKVERNYYKAGTIIHHPNAGEYNYILSQIKSTLTV